MRKIYSIAIAMILFTTAISFGQSSQVAPVSFSTQADFGVQCSGGQIHDDGVAENGYGWNTTAGNPASFCTKFIPTGYPYKFSKYCIALTRLSTGVANWNFKIVMWKSVNGAPGVIMDTTSVTANAVPVWPTVSFFDFNLPATWANVTGTDSVFIGISFDATTQTGVFVGSDESVTTPIWPAWVTTAAGPWQAPTALWAGYRAFLQRAEGSVSNPVPTGTWTEQVSGLTSVLYSVSAVSDDVAWVCGAAGKVLRTTNKGVTWTNISGTLPVAAALYNIYAWDANTAVVTGVTGTNTSIYQTSNAGTTWTVANTHAGFGDDMFMTDASTAYFIGDPSGGNWDLLKSTNAGLNWASWATLPTTNTAGTYNNAFFQQGTQVWFPSVGQSQMLYSSNLGANWSTQTLTLAEITATCFTSATRGLAAGSSTSPGLLGTTDAGTTWTAVTQSFIGTSSVAGIVGASTSWWAALQAATVYKSTNDGAAFTLDYTAPTAGGVFYHITKSRTGATIWGVRSLGGISRYGQPIIGINPVSNEIPSSYSVSQNFPNPFNPTTKINFALPKSGLVSLKVYDMLGKEVATLVNEVKNAGTYSVDFNASALSSGIYFYKVSVNGFSEVKKMMLIK